MRLSNIDLTSAEYQELYRKQKQMMRNPPVPRLKNARPLTSRQQAEQIRQALKAAFPWGPLR